MSRWPEAAALSVLLHLMLLAIPALAVQDVVEPEAEDDELALVELLVEEPELLAGVEPTPAPSDETTPGPIERDEGDRPEQALEQDRPEEPALEERDRREERHVRVDDTLPTALTSPDTDRVAARDVHVAEDTRATVPTMEWGPESPGTVGAPGTVGNASPKQRSEELAEGARSDDDAEEVAKKREARTQHQDEVQPAEGTDRGQPTASGPKSLAEREGGNDGRDLAGDGARERSVASSGQPSQHVEGSPESSPLAPDGWEPFAVRIDPSEGRPAPTAKASEIDGQVDTDSAVPVQARSERKARPTGDGGEGEVRVALPAFDEESPALAELEDEGEPTPETARAWGGEQLIDPDTEAGSTGRVDLVGAQATTSKTTVERDVEDGPVTAVSARAHELGPYRDSLEEGIHERWIELTPLEVRAMGFQGTAVVRFEVDRRGRVVTKTLVKRSGYPQLDDVALAAIPRRVEKPPKGAAEPTFAHTIEFRNTDRWASTQ